MSKAAVKSSKQPPAVGYIRVNEATDGKIAAFLKDIATCCLREGLRLTRSFCDQGYDGTPASGGVTWRDNSAGLAR